MLGPGAGPWCWTLALDPGKPLSVALPDRADHGTDVVHPGELITQLKQGYWCHLSSVLSPSGQDCTGNNNELFFWEEELQLCQAQ